MVYVLIHHLLKLLLRLHHLLNTKKTGKYYQSSIVKKVQKKLNKLGYNCGKADGIYGTKTKNAIKDFQSDEGMNVNGEIKKALLKKLKTNI